MGHLSALLGVGERRLVMLHVLHLISRRLRVELLQWRDVVTKVTRLLSDLVSHYGMLLARGLTDSTQDFQCLIFF